MTREDRIARNEALFREVNERVVQVTDPGADERIDFLCECGDGDCAQTIALTRRQYEDVRSDPALFAVVPGHVVPTVEDIVAEGDGFQVVRKHLDQRDIVTQTDPRSP